MDGMLQAFVQFAQHHLQDVIQISAASDLFYYALGIVLICLLVMLVAYFTVKRIVIHLITGYIALYIAQFLGVHVEPDALMITLMAVFGPIPVICVAGWQWLF